MRRHRQKQTDDGGYAIPFNGLRKYLLAAKERPDSGILQRACGFCSRCAESALGENDGYSLSSGSEEIPNSRRRV